MYCRKTDFVWSWNKLKLTICIIKFLEPAAMNHSTSSNNPHLLTLGPWRWQLVVAIIPLGYHKIYFSSSLTVTAMIWRLLDSMEASTQSNFKSNNLVWQGHNFFNKQCSYCIHIHQEWQMTIDWWDTHCRQRLLPANLLSTSALTDSIKLCIALVLSIRRRDYNE